MQHCAENVWPGSKKVRHGAKNVRHVAKNVQHGAQNVRHGAENVRHGAKNVRPYAENVRNGAENVLYGPPIPQSPIQRNTIKALERDEYPDNIWGQVNKHAHKQTDTIKI